MASQGQGSLQESNGNEATIKHKRKLIMITGKEADHLHWQLGCIVTCILVPKGNPEKYKGKPVFGLGHCGRYKKSLYFSLIPAWYDCRSLALFFYDNRKYQVRYEEKYKLFLYLYQYLYYSAQVPKATSYSTWNADNPPHSKILTETTMTAAAGTIMFSDAMFTCILCRNLRMNN